MFGYIIGCVKDATNGIGINGATVSNNFLNIGKHSRERGQYSMISCPGDFTLEASARDQGYNNQSKGVIVSGGKITRVDFVLTPAQ